MGVGWVTTHTQDLDIYINNAGNVAAWSLLILSMMIWLFANRDNVRQELPVVLKVNVVEFPRVRHGFVACDYVPSFENTLIQVDLNKYITEVILQGNEILLFEPIYRVNTYTRAL